MAGVEEKQMTRSSMKTKNVRCASAVLVAVLFCACIFANASTLFPLQASANGRYLVDQNGAPFRIQGEASWDAHINLNLTDLRAYLDDRQAKGFNALFTYVANPVAYYAGDVAPWAVQLGGSAAGVAALPFTKNAGGGIWNGDPNFSNHDADFGSPNDAYFAWVAQFVDEAATRGMVVMLTPMYLGYGLGNADGWYHTVTNSANTQAVCFAFGQYLANGHGTFSGFKNRPNIIWIHGGDTLPPNGSEAALRALQILKGMQAAGDTHLQTAHWQHDYLTSDQTDFAPYFTASVAYTHGAYPSAGPTYIESRVSYAQAPARPLWLLETNYWGDHGATQAQLRYFSWGAALSTIGGVTVGFSPFWGFATSADGTTSTSSGGTTTAWIPSTHFDLNQYVSKTGRWYRATTSGSSGASGPSGTGASISDGSVVWTYAATGGISALFNEPGVLDFVRMGLFLDGVRWFDLVPSNLDAMPVLITAGTGTYASWSDGGSANGGMDWVVAAATRDGKSLIAYVPDAHSGSITVNMTAMSALARVRWFDPTNASYTSIGNFPNTGTQVFTPPAANAGGTHDWVLVLDRADSIFADGFGG
jgi:Protein of unknown function (DUF4038)/Putative collagen-binding domain of a collagenase